MKAILRIFFNLTACMSILIFIISNSYAIDNVFEKSSEGKLFRIEQLYIEGKIGLGDKVFYNLQAIYSDSSLPEGVRSDSPEIIKSATGIILEAYQYWDLMSPEQRSQASDYLTRGGFDAIYVSPESNFSIHYDTIGTEAVPAEDIDINGIPDYVERIGLYADSSFRYYHNTLGYLPPPKESEDPYVIYLVRIGAYGATVPDVPGDSSWNDFTSHIEIHCDFEGPLFGPNDDPEGRIIGDQKVTCAHEYYHAVQLAYDFNYDNLWWMECTAVYFEDVLFPEVNDNYNYLNYFFNYPDISLVAPTFHKYSTFIWASFLVEKFGIDMLKSSFEYLRYYDPLPSIDSALNLYGQQVKTVFPEFALWNYFTSERAEPIYHKDAVDYPLIEIDQVVTGFPSAVVEPINPPDGLGSNYIICRPDPSENGFFMFHFDGSQYVKWGLTSLVFEDSKGVDIQSYPVDYNGLSHWGVYDFAVIDSMIIIPCVVSQYISDNAYNIAVEVISYGDVDFSSGTPNILDVIFIINQIYKDGPLPDYDLRMSDVNCDGIINILDVVYLINSIYKDGSTPGPCRY